MTILVHADVTIDTKGVIYVPGGLRIGQLDDGVLANSEHAAINTYLYDVVKRYDMQQAIADYLMAEDMCGDEDIKYAEAHAEQIFQIMEQERTRIDDNESSD